MLITAHNDIYARGHSTCEKFVISRIHTYGPWQPCGSAEFRIDNDEIKDGADLHTRKFLVEFDQHRAVLVEDLRCYDKPDLPPTP